MADIRLDADGQPDPALNYMRRVDRDLAELLGLLKGVLSDGVVERSELEKLNEWCQAHPDVSTEWPGNVLVRRLERVFDDGEITEAERMHLAELLHDLVGGEAGVVLASSVPSNLPLDDPPPAIEVPDRVFVFTGRMAFGPRRECAKETKKIGGWVEDNVTFRTDYLVIGTFGSRDWTQSSHGRKIEKAVEYRDQKDASLAIIGEDHWARAID